MNAKDVPFGTRVSLGVGSARTYIRANVARSIFAEHKQDPSKTVFVNVGTGRLLFVDKNRVVAA